jgi:hypothetical protein
MRQHNKNIKLATTLAALCAALSATAVQATSLPPTTFTNNVVLGRTSICPTDVNAATDGVCTSGASYAHTDGGIPGTPGYVAGGPLGTNVSSGATGRGVSSLATMTYYFEVGGPAVPGGLIAVDIVSSGDALISGDTGRAVAAMVITDSGSDADILAGTPDPDRHFVVDYHFDSVNCAFGRCTELGSAWAQADQFHGDHLCLTQGDMYAITITASSASGWGGSSSASVDPKIIVDPQGPTDPKASCFQPANPMSYSVSISNGASTGVPVAEPGVLGLMGLGLLAVGLRRARQRSGRPD